jgi:hypothetical protein
MITILLGLSKTVIYKFTDGTTTYSYNIQSTNLLQFHILQTFNLLMHHPDFQKKGKQLERRFSNCISTTKNSSGVVSIAASDLGGPGLNSWPKGCQT